jgi:hypothetical protein
MVAVFVRPDHLLFKSRNDPSTKTGSGQTQGKTTQKHAHAGGGRRERAQHEVDAGEKKERNSPSFFFALLVDEMRRWFDKTGSGHTKASCSKTGDRFRSTALQQSGYISLRSLSYYTDNGAYYYYQTANHTGSCSPPDAPCGKIIAPLPFDGASSSFYSRSFSLCVWFISGNFVSGTVQVPATSGRCGAKNSLFEPFILKTIFLPRQARYKHRENSFNRPFFVRELFAYFDDIELPIAAVQYDSWWYYKGKKQVRTRHLLSTCYII